MSKKSYIVFPLRRIIASIYDFFLLLGIWFLVGSVALGVGYLFTGEINGEAIQNFGLFLVFLSTWAFYSYFWLKGGKTLGMSVWRFQIYSLDGKKINLKQTSIRFLFNLVTFFLGGLPLLLIYFSKDNLSLSDLISKTSYKKF